MLTRKEKIIKNLAFMSLGGMALNAVLLTHGVDVIAPIAHVKEFWTPEVYSNPILGAGFGATTGIALGAMAGVALEVTKESVKFGI